MTPYEQRAIADELKRLSDDTETQIDLTDTDEGYTVTHELYQHVLRLNNGQELTLTGEFAVRWTEAQFQGDYLQPSDPPEIEAIESVNLYAARLYGSAEQELIVDDNEIERLANERTKTEQRAANTAALDRALTMPA